MKIRKRLQASGFSFIVLNFVEKALHIFLIMMDYVKSALSNRQQLPTQIIFKENHGNTNKINFQFHYRKFSK